MFSPIFLYWCYSRIFFFSYKRKLLISHFGCLKIMYSLIFFFLILVSVCFPSHFVFPLHQYSPVLNSIANGSRLSESIELESFYGIYFLLFSYYDRFFVFFFFQNVRKKLQSMSSWGACGEASTLVSVDASIGSLRYTKPVSNCAHFNQ